MDDSDAGRRDFDLLSHDWDANPARVELAQAIARAVLREVPISKDMDVLDYGAGTGLVTLGLEPHARSVLAADSSEGMLEKVRGKIASSGLGDVQTVLLDLERDPAPDMRFGLIVSSMTMHHIGDVGRLLGVFHEMLEPNGYLAIADLDPDGGRFHSDPTGVKHDGFERAHMERMFGEAGFRDVRTVTAHVVRREDADQIPLEFTVFLVVGNKVA